MDTPSPALAALLRDPDIRCPACRHGLFGITADTCPECGMKLRAGLVTPSARPTLPIWMILLWLTLSQALGVVGSIQWAALNAEIVKSSVWGSLVSNPMTGVQFAWQCLGLTLPIMGLILLNNRFGNHYGEDRRRCLLVGLCLFIFAGDIAVRVLAMVGFWIDWPTWAP